MSLKFPSQPVFPQTRKLKAKWHAELQEEAKDMEKPKCYRCKNVIDNHIFIALSSVLQQENQGSWPREKMKSIYFHRDCFEAISGSEYLKELMATSADEFNPSDKEAERWRQLAGLI